MGAGSVILLDTTYLIRLLVPGSPETDQVMAWLTEHELCASAINWYELASGPVDEEGEAIVPSMIATAAIVAKAGLATGNLEDFRGFEGEGLRLWLG